MMGISAIIEVPTHTPLSRPTAGRGGAWYRQTPVDGLGARGGSAAGAAGDHANGFLVLQAEYLGQDLVGVLPEARRREAGAVVVAEDRVLVSLVGHFAHLGVFEAAEER